MSNEIIGSALSRIDGRQKVTGAARYSAEYDLPGRAHAVCIQSTIASGRIVRIDTREAEAAPGVLAILTYLNAPRLNPFPTSSARSKPDDASANAGGRGGQSGQSNGQNGQGGQGGQGTAQPRPQGHPGQKLLPLQDDRIYYSGQHIGVVVADTLEQATHAASLVRFEYATERPITDHDLDRRLNQAYAAPDQAGREPNHSRRGDPDIGLASAAVRIEQTYIVPVENHNPMEPSATTAAWQGDRLTLYDATQGVSGTEQVVATLLGIPAENVRVISYFLGGGFGCKGSMWPHTVLAAIAAQKVGRPVTLALTRRQMFTSVGYRARTVQRVSLGATRDGRLTAIRHVSTNLTAPYEDFVERAAGTTPMLYACPSVEATHRLVRVNRGTPTFMRAPGEAPGVYALEAAMDELADALNLDPIELRLRNYAEEDPGKHLPWSSKSLRECYRLGAEKFGWSRRDPTPRSMREGDWLVGWGMATATYPTNRSAASATVQVYSDGHARAVSGTQDLGTGTYTIMTQIAAENLGMPVTSVHFELGDTRMPVAPNSGGSQTAASVGSAVKAAAQNAQAKLIELALGDSASPVYGRTADQIETADGRIRIKGNPDRGESFIDLLLRNKRDRIEADGAWKPGDEAQHYSMHAFGAQFAEVKVHPASGEVRVTRFVGAFGAGRILNAKTGRSQFMGGMVFGIGMALLEESVMDPHLGRVMNADLAEYLLPVNRDVPPIEVYWVDEEDPYVNPNGAKGIGEIGIVGAAAAIANAVYHATGRRIRELPITPDKLL